jgi:hypothetical protein
MTDLNAAFLNSMGFDDEALTFHSARHDFRLTDAAGSVVHEIFA